MRPFSNNYPLAHITHPFVLPQSLHRAQSFRLFTWWIHCSARKTHVGSWDLIHLFCWKHTLGLVLLSIPLPYTCRALFLLTLTHMRNFLQLTTTHTRPCPCVCFPSNHMQSLISPSSCNTHPWGLISVPYSSFHNMGALFFWSTVKQMCRIWVQQTQQGGLKAQAQNLRSKYLVRHCSSNLHFPNSFLLQMLDNLQSNNYQILTTVPSTCHYLTDLLSHMLFLLPLYL